MSPEITSPEIKICGINSTDAFDAAVSCGADWIGFVFYARSPRAVTPEEAARLSARRAGGPGRVGLFVEPDPAMIAAVLATVTLDALQLYGEPRRLAGLGERFGLPVWRAVGVANARDLPRQADAERLVVEAKPPPDATRPGGNAQRLDWSLLSGWAAPVPWMLAGGLSPANVARALAATNAGAVDVSSGVEIAPGVKSPHLIRAFVEAARGSGRASVSPPFVLRPSPSGG
ncbi:MAG: phosphoribosylanthranilate isomerase [Acetobacteraceae bacterium]|nr:phosphoribosylanthranilate isomerase [Acetobacteraceae bacterium]